MTEEQLKNWFLNKFYSCYPVKHDDYPDSIYLFYDKLYLRKCYLLNILDREPEPPKIGDGVCLFNLNLKNNYLYCDYDNIWTFLEEKYSNNYSDVQALIKNWMVEYDKISVGTTLINMAMPFGEMVEYDKISVGTTNLLSHKKGMWLEDKLVIIKKFTKPCKNDNNIRLYGCE
jgi:hypothetical protein